MKIPADLSAIFDYSSLPPLGPEARDSALSFSQCQKRTTEALDNCGIGETESQLIHSAALLWHDHLNESHAISQSIHSPDGSYLHGIMHRREPDYPNAKYWFHKAGNHPAYALFTERVQTLLTDSTVTVLTQDKWDPFAMVDAVSQAKRGTGEYEALQKAQQAEFQILLERFCS